MPLHLFSTAETIPQSPPNFLTGSPSQTSFERMAVPEVEQREMKLVLVGNSNVGKTCIARMATTGNFTEDANATIGASYVSKVIRVDNIDVRLQIWDTAGQERYRGMTPMYFRGAQAAVIVYSITEELSLKGIDYWIHTLRENSDPSVRVFLVGNKADLESQRAVSAEMGRRRAEDISALFYEVSAKSGEGVDDLFLAIAKSEVEAGKEKKAAGLQLEAKSQKKGCC
jgi:Ras-related protein Rab-5C